MSAYKITVSGGLPAFPLATAFVDNYMPEANPTFVKVYLYGLRLCYSADTEVNNKNIADALGILESDVVLAWKYWEEQGVVRMGKGIEFVDLTLQPKKETKNKKPQYRAREMAVAIANNADISLIIEHAENIFGKTFSTAETGILYGLYDWLELPPEVILMLLEYCASIEKNNVRYMEKIAIEWSENGIDSIDKAEEYLRLREEKSKISKKYKRLLRITGRELSDSEYAHIIQWTREMSMPDELIKSAYEKAVMATGDVSFPYINAILQSWHRQGITTADEIKNDVKPAAQTEKRGRNRFTDYEQSGLYDIEKLEKIALKKRLKQEA